jgi:hypothetical protein
MICRDESRLQSFGPTANPSAAHLVVVGCEFLRDWRGTDGRNFNTATVATADPQALRSARSHCDKLRNTGNFLAGWCENAHSGAGQLQILVIKSITSQPIIR